MNIVNEDAPTGEVQVTVVCADGAESTVLFGRFSPDNADQLEALCQFVYDAGGESGDVAVAAQGPDRDVLQERIGEALEGWGG